MRLFSLFRHPESINTYIVAPDHGSNATIIDPYIFDTQTITFLNNSKLLLKSALLTHNNFNFNTTLAIIKKIYTTDFSVLDTIKDLNFSSEPAFCETIIFNNLQFKIIDLSIDNYFQSAYKIENLLFTGTTLQAGTVGYTKNYSTKKRLCKMIKNKLLSLPDSTLVLPFNGPPTSIKIERQFNIEFSITNQNKS